MVPQTPLRQTSKRPSRLVPPLTSLSSQSVEQTVVYNYRTCAGLSMLPNSPRF